MLKGLDVWANALQMQCFNHRAMKAVSTDPTRLIRYLVCLRLRFGILLELLAALALLDALCARAAVDWPALGFTPTVTNVFNRPTCIAHAGDGSQRLFVAEQSGAIWLIQNSNVQAEAFLNITDRVNSAGAEQGLLGIAFPPGFSTNHHFYVDYTIGSNNAVVISRFQLSSTNESVADAQSEEVILNIPKPFNNHNGGQLAFGPDGYLYIGVGDGGAEGDPQGFGQNSNSLLAKILRIDVESGVSPYAIPSSNPFLNQLGYAAETWAWGLRNPWRFSFDRQTGDLYIGDVGQSRFEEIDFQPAGSPGGQNYGWRIMEGPTNFNVPPGFTNFSALTLPVVWYDHLALPTDLSGSVTGGYVYRGPSEARMDGLYFYGDFIAGWIWGLKQVDTNWQSFPLLSPGSSPHYFISTFGEDDVGHLYFADYYRGTVYQVIDTGQVWTPEFLPASGTINSNTVVVSCSSPNADIHFTTNGIDPTAKDPVVVSGGTIQVVSGLTNKARAFRSDLQPSAVASGVFTLKVGNPFFTPPSGAISNHTPVTISTITLGAAIYYTTNGAAPTTNSLLYTGPVILSGGVTLRAIAVAPGYSNSAPVAVTYSTLHVATPSFATAGSNPTPNPIQVSISCATPSATIHITTDGTTPDTNSPVYSVPIVISQPTTLTAIAYRDDLGPSALQSVFYAFIYFDNTVVTTLAGASSGGFSNAPGTLALFATPQGLCLDGAGNLLVADRDNHLIRKVSPSGLVETFAGTGTDGTQDGTVADAQFQEAAGVCRDPAGNVFVSEGACGEWRIRKIDTNGLVTTVASVPNVCSSIGELETDPGDTLYAAYGNVLNKVTPDGQVQPMSVYAAGVALDQMTNLYAVEGGQVWKIAPDGTQTLLAGSPNVSGFSDGPALLALFGGLQDSVVDASGNIFLSDYTRIRKLSAQGAVTSLAGTDVPGYVNGPGPNARFNNVTGLCQDANGNLYVADSGNNCIRKISPDTAGIGIADDWQLAHFGRIGIDPNADPDHDGMSNYAEFWAGTDPLDANSVLQIESPIQLSSGLPEIRWRTVVGKTYIVQYSTDFISWSALGSPVQGDGQIATSIDTSANGRAVSRYYRIALTAF